jgi:hypothetical protein
MTTTHEQHHVTCVTTRTPHRHTGSTMRMADAGHVNAAQSLHDPIRTRTVRRQGTPRLTGWPKTQRCH